MATRHVNAAGNTAGLGDEPGAHALPDRERYAIRKAIQKLKTEISIEDYLREHGVEVRRNRARCIVHGGDNPQSFSIDPQKQLWHCFSCGHGGDLVALCGLVEEHASTRTAVVSLSEKFGVKLPERPPRWFDWQEEKSAIRDFNERIKRERRIRRWFRIYHRDDLSAIPDPEERRIETERCWRALQKWMPPVRFSR